MRRSFLKGVLEGFAGSIVIDCVATFLLLLNETSIPPVLVGLLGAGVSATVYTLFAQSNKTNTELICFSLVGLFSFILFYAGIFVIRILNPFGFFVKREGNNSDSIVLLIGITCFIIASIILKLCALVIVIIRNAIRRNKEQRDGSVVPESKNDSN